MIPRVRFGNVDPATTDWRDAPDDDPDDEQLDETPSDVVGMLGFDPAEETDA